MASCANHSMESLKSSFVAIFLTFSLAILPLITQVQAHGGISHDDDADSTTDHDGKGLVLVKIWCLIILLVSTFAGGVSPYFYRWNEGFLVLGTQFAGGVFMGTSLMHFLSDSNQTFKDLTPKPYPFAFMLASAGYLLTMFGDCIVMYVTNSNERESKIDVDEGEEHGVHGTMKDDKLAFLKGSSIGDTVLLILALCFHSVFEGIAIGVSDTKADAWRNLWTISLHKIFAAVAMGIALLRLIPKRPFVATVAYSFAFAVSSLIGE